MNNKYFGAQRWYTDHNGSFHCDDGPAIIYPDGDMDWYWHGSQMSFKTWLTVTLITDEAKLLLRLQYD
jgi:hypothetical protein